MQEFKFESVIVSGRIIEGKWRCYILGIEYELLRRSRCNYSLYGAIRSFKLIRGLTFQSICKQAWELIQIDFKDREKALKKELREIKKRTEKYKQQIVDLKSTSKELSAHQTLIKQIGGK